MGREGEGIPRGVSGGRVVQMGSLGQRGCRRGSTSLSNVHKQWRFRCPNVGLAGTAEIRKTEANLQVALRELQASPRHSSLRSMPPPCLPFPNETLFSQEPLCRLSGHAMVAVWQSDVTCDSPQSVKQQEQALLQRRVTHFKREFQEKIAELERQFLAQVGSSLPPQANRAA